MRIRGARQDWEKKPVCPISAVVIWFHRTTTSSTSVGSGLRVLVHSESLYHGSAARIRSRPFADAHCLAPLSLQAELSPALVYIPAICAE